ncbi:MAG: HAD-IA family hydrolase [Pseudomonadota bacterium]
MLKLQNFDALTFDVYGTILNWEPEIAEALTSWTASHGKSISQTDLLSAYDRARQPLQERRPALQYPEIQRQTLLRLGEEFDLPVPPEMLGLFGTIAATHQPFPDSKAALDELRGMGLKLAALSNIDDASFKQVTSSAGLAFDVVVTAQRVGAYKPDQAHFWAALSDLQALGIPMNRVLHVAQSRRADIVVANAIGLTSVWVNRPGHAFGRVGRGAETAQPDYEIDSLATLVTLLQSR